MIRRLSTGQLSTLKNYHDLAVVVFGPTSKAVRFLEQKIQESPNGEDEEVIADESQMVMALIRIEIGGSDEEVRQAV